MGDNNSIQEITVTDQFMNVTVQSDDNNYRAGFQGDKGDRGIQGVQGVQGIQGPQGLQGPQGIQGTPGTNGADGTGGTVGPAGPGVPAGGTANQLLQKSTSTAYDSQWTSNLSLPTGGGVNLSSNTPTGSISKLVKFTLTTAFDRPWLSWVDQNGRQQCAAGWHDMDYADQTSHHRFEIKTSADPAGTQPAFMATRFAIESDKDRVAAFLSDVGTFYHNYGVYQKNQLFGLAQQMPKADGTGTYTLNNWRVQLDTNDNTVVQFDPTPITNTKTAVYRFFRTTNTTGSVQLRIAKGDNTNVDTVALDAHTGGVWATGQVGTGYTSTNSGTAPTIALNAGGSLNIATTTVPATVNAGSIELYNEADELKYKKSNGKVGVLNNSDPHASDNGLLVWNYDPVAALNNTVLDQGRPYYARMKVSGIKTINSVVLYVATAGTNGGYVGLFDEAGTLLGKSSVDLATVWNTTGSKTIPLSAPVSLQSQVVYVSVLATGVSRPALARGTGTAGNAGLSANYRWSQAGTTTATDLATVTMSSQNASIASLWFGLA